MTFCCFPGKRRIDQHDGQEQQHRGQGISRHGHKTCQVEQASRRDGRCSQQTGKGERIFFHSQAQQAIEYNNSLLKLLVSITLNCRQMAMLMVL